MTRQQPWTIAVADAANPANPSIAYVTGAHDRDDAIARVHAHHTSVYGCDADRILTVAAYPGNPPADAWYGWTDLRGIKALPVVLEPDQVRQLARLRLRLRRWNTMMAPHYADEDATGDQIPPSACLQRRSRSHLPGPRPDPVRAGERMTETPVFGLIEWDGSYRPTVIAGCCFDAVIRNIIAIFTALAASDRAVGSPQFQQDYPLPDPHAPVEVLADWLDLLREDTTVPYVTLMDSTEIVNTGDQLLVMDWHAANPYYSRPGPHRSNAHHRLPAGRPGDPAAPATPTVVNGYPVMAPVAEREDATSWIVICRRTERPPDWAEGTTGA